MNDSKQALRDERAARARAARAYAKLDQADIAKVLGQSTVTVKRMEAGARDISLDDLYAIAKLCGVPKEFMDNGFESVPAELKRIHERFDVLTQRIGWSVAQTLAGDTLAALAGDDGEELRATAAANNDG